MNISVEESYTNNNCDYCTQKSEKMLTLHDHINQRWKHVDLCDTCFEVISAQVNIDFPSVKTKVR